MKKLILNELSKSINKLSDLELVVIVLGIAMVLMSIAWDWGREFAQLNQL